MHRSCADLPPSGPPSTRSLVLLLASAVDCDAMALWCRHRIDCDAIECLFDFESGLDLCRRLRPRLLAIDPASGANAIGRATTLLRQQHIEHLLVLDQWPLELRLAELLPEPGASYFSRAAPAAALASAIAQLLDQGGRVFDPALAPRLRRTPRGLAFDYSPQARAIVELSDREREVLIMLAEGKTVRQCAAVLGKSSSTIDNHKGRLMKKLGVHKSSELMVCALRQGLIGPFR